MPLDPTNSSTAAIIPAIVVTEATEVTDSTAAEAQEESPSCFRKQNSTVDYNKKIKRYNAIKDAIIIISAFALLSIAIYFGGYISSNCAYYTILKGIGVLLCVIEIAIVNLYTFTYSIQTLYLKEQLMIADIYKEHKRLSDLKIDRQSEIIKENTEIMNYRERIIRALEERSGLFEAENARLLDQKRGLEATNYALTAEKNRLQEELYKAINAISGGG